MLFPSIALIALILSILHLLICFTLKVPETYKKLFRAYSVVVNVLFIGFLISFLLFLDINQYIATYYNGLATLYFFLVVPLGLVVFSLMRNRFIKANLEPIFLKDMLVAGAGIAEVVLLIVGYSLFILTFYGVAP